MKNKKNILINSIFLLICASLAVFGVYKTMQSLVETAKTTGKEIAKNFVVIEENESADYEIALENALREINYLKENNVGLDYIKDWFEEYLIYMKDVLDINDVEIYGYINNNFISATHWDGDKTYVVNGKDWYEKAINANGKIVYTDVYQDVRTGKMVVTISKSIKDTNNVIAMDIFPHLFISEYDINELPEGTMRILFDKVGNIISYETNDNRQTINLENIDFIYDNILENISNNINEFVINDINNNKNYIYCYTNNKGWISSVIIPNDTLMSDIYNMAGICVVLYIMYFIIIAVIYIRERKNNKIVIEKEKIIKALGNTYYAIYILDISLEKYKIIKCNLDFYNKLHFDRDYSRFLSVAKDFIDEKHRDDFVNCFSIENIRDIVKKGIRHFSTDYMRNFDGEYKWINASVLSTNDILNINEVILAFRSINDERIKEIEKTNMLKMSLFEAKKNAKSKSEFFSRMSHDMRTPLNAIIGLSKLSEENIHDTDKIMDYIQKIKFSSRHLLLLVNDVLDMAKIEQGRFEIGNSEFNIKEQIENILSIFSQELEKTDKNLVVDLNIKNSLVIGDFFRIEQIFNNILSNALKFTNKNDTISVIVNQIENQNMYNDEKIFQIIIKDTGIGMSKEFLDKIFMPFEREKNFGISNSIGTGLGMTIVYNIVKMMQGQIFVESEINKGSKFKITIPLKISNNSVDNNESINEYDLDKKDTLEVDLKGKRVLIVEDNEINMEIAVEMLSMYDVETTKAWNGKEAVEKFVQSPNNYFDVILMDMQMPVMNGCDASKSIRMLDREDARNIPIIAVTANAFSEDITATAEAGMNAHIPKPIDFKFLNETINKLIKQNKK